MIKHYKDLLVYQQSYEQALKISKLILLFPRHEQFGMVHQMGKACRSIPANIAEGWAKRDAPREFKRFLQMAIGSCEEMKVWLDFSKDEKYITGKQHETFQAEYAKIGTLL